MAETVTTTIRLDKELKDELTRDLDVLGININAYFTMAAKQLVLKKRVPFELSTSGSYIPNETTRRALIIAEAKDLGLIPEDTPSFDNVDDMMEWLDEE